MKKSTMKNITFHPKTKPIFLGSYKQALIMVKLITGERIFIVLH